MNAISTSNPVRVSIPASIAADIGSLKKTVGSILDKLGCQACCSGHDIFFELQRDIFLRSDLKAPAELAATPRLAAAKFAEPKVARVGLNPEVVGKIDNVFAAIDRIAEISGHPACCSGQDLFFQLERNFVVDAKINISEQVMRFG